MEAENFKLPRYILIDLDNQLMLCASAHLDGISNFVMNDKTVSITQSLTEATKTLMNTEDKITETVVASLDKLPIKTDEELTRRTIKTAISGLKWDSKSETERA